MEIQVVLYHQNMAELAMQGVTHDKLEQINKKLDLITPKANSTRLLAAHGKKILQSYRRS